MAKIAKNLMEFIGDTPLMKLAGYGREYGLQRDIVTRSEFFNPAGNVKDRVGSTMIKDTGAHGVLKPGVTIIELTSGNAGVGLAMVATTEGYHPMLIMSETMNIGRRNLLKAFGAGVVLMGDVTGTAGSIARAKELRDRTPGTVILQQFENPSNVKAYELITGEGIWRDTDGQMDVSVARVGTGDMACDATRALKKHDPDIYAVVVEPASPPVPEGGEAAPYRTQGIGTDFVPALYDTSMVDEVIPVSDGEAIRAGRKLASVKELLAGVSSGTAVYAARLLAKRLEFTNKMVVASLPDTGKRYPSMELLVFGTYPLE